MQAGLLWYDNTAKPLAEKVGEAAAHFVTKFGRPPTVAYVSARVLSDVQVLADIRCQPAANILKDHIWIGCDD